jgi:hypothetical protein
MSSALMSNPSPLVSFDADLFRSQFDREPFLVQHHLPGHRLFEMDRIVELSRSLPADRVEYNAGNVPITLDPKNTPRTGLSPEETIRRIEECRSWLVLKNVEHDPEYAQLLRDCLEPMRSIVPDMRSFESFLFVSSPGSVTPFHIDPECNFLLQVRGRKTVRMFPRDNPAILTEEELERFYAGATRNLICRDEQGATARVFDLLPGQGLHFPVTMPHWVQNGPEVSISFSVTFRTGSSDRREILYRINHHLRKIGWRPAPVGRAPWADQLKYITFDAARRARHLLTGQRDESAGRSYTH